MGKIVFTSAIAAPVDVVFAYVDDHTNTTKYMKDLTRWEPTGSRTHGKGATFAIAMKAGPSELASVVDITEYQKDKVIGWVSKEGFKQSGRWAFRKVGEGCEVSFEMQFELPGGIAGRVMSRVAEPAVRASVERSVDQLRQQTEKLAKGRPKAAAAGTRKPAR